MNIDMPYPSCECGHLMALHGDRAVTPCGWQGQDAERVWRLHRCWCKGYTPVTNAAPDQGE